MIDFNFQLTEEDADLLVDCVRQEVAHLKDACHSIDDTEDVIMHDDRAKFAIERHIAQSRAY